MKIKTSELTGTALDWAVAKCEGWRRELCYLNTEYPTYSTNWSLCGPIIEREKLGVWMSADQEQPDQWACATDDWMTMEVESQAFVESSMPYHGPTLLIAAMRCYVAHKLGDKIDIPEELV